MKKQTTFLLTMLLVALISIEANAQVEQDPGAQGLAYFAAEDYDSKIAGTANTNQGPANQFIESTAIPGFLGDGYIKGENDGVYAGIDNAYLEGAVINYEINFTKTGTHYLWTHMYFADGSNDSFYFTVGDDIPDEQSRVEGTPYAAWTWKKGKNSFEVATTGVQTFRVYMRERQAAFDDFVITTDATYDPTADPTLGIEDKVSTISTKLRAVGSRIYVSNVKSKTEINLYSITGALVKSIKTNEDADFSFKSGLWIATLKTNEGQKSVKLLVD